MSEYKQLIDFIHNLKREKHSKNIDLALIVEKFGEFRDDVSDLIDELIRVGVLKSDLDKKRTRTLISTTDVILDEVIEDLKKETCENVKRKQIVIDDSKWLNDIMDPSELNFEIEKDAFVCYSEEKDGDEYITKRDLSRHTTMILKKLDSVKKEMSFENFLCFDKFEKYQKSLLDSTLKNLHEEIQEKRQELNALRETMKTTAIPTASPTETTAPDDSEDIPSRQPCNNPAFFRPTYKSPPPTDILQTPEILRPNNTISTPIQRQSATIKKRPSICITEKHATNNRTSFIPLAPSTTRREPTPTPTQTVPGNSSYASIATQGRKTVVLTDSHGSRIKGKELSKWIDNGIGLIRSFPGSTATDMLSYAIPTIQNDKPDQVILHVGCNEILKGEKDARKIADNIFEAARFCRRGGVNSVYISGILVMNSFNHNNIARKVNYILSTEGPLENFYFINNTRITKDMLHDRIHFNDIGRNLLANNFINSINGNFLY